jgi:hypothetical protein
MAIILPVAAIPAVSSEIGLIGSWREEIHARTSSNRRHLWIHAVPDEQ